jgi:cytoskeletal protein CcmA (bactofilin family)
MGMQLSGSLQLTGSITVSGISTFGGNLVPLTASGSTLGTVDMPFRDIYIQSASINIASDTPGEPNTSISNIDGNLLVSAGGMKLIGTGSFIADTGSFGYISGSLTQVGDYIRIGNTILVGNQQSTGSLNISGSLHITGSTSITGSLMVNNLIYPITDNGSESFIQTDGAGNLSLQYVKTLYQNVRNLEAITIQKGTPLFISGSTGDNANIYIADATNPARMPATLIAGDNIESLATGRGIIFGHIEGVDTNIYTPGTAVYVGAGGGWIGIRPTGSTTPIQPLGIVTRQGNNGMGIVMTETPYNLPNIQSGYMWVGDDNSYPISISTSSFAKTGSNTFIGDQTITGSLSISGSLNINGLSAVTSSNVFSIQTITSASYAALTPASGTLYIIIG